MVDLNDVTDEDSDDEEAKKNKERKEKRQMKRKLSKHLVQKKSEGNLMGDLLKNSLGNFFKKKVIETKDDSLKTEEQKKEETAQDELSKSERYRQNVAKFVEMARKGKEERERI